MKEALYYKKLKDKKVQCQLCPNNCLIADGNVGFCCVRKNNGGKLFSLVYGKPVSVAIDPIEKKPLFHFLPGSYALSIGTVGCNLACKHCQNWEIAIGKPGQYPENDLLPEKVVELAIAKDCKSISYTYNEPTIFYEYVLDTAKIARKKGIKNTMVTNGFINLEPLRELYKYIDAANVDLKAFNEKFYKDVSAAQLKPVLEAIKEIKKMGVWLELTNLIIPGYNDDIGEIKKMCKWIVDNLGKDIPLHFSRFFPHYKMQDVEPTPAETLIKAKEIAKKAGLNYVFIGNIQLEDSENTYCPKCGELLIERGRFSVAKNKINKDKCFKCDHKIKGVFE